MPAQQMMMQVEQLRSVGQAQARSAREAGGRLPSARPERATLSSRTTNSVFAGDS